MTQSELGAVLGGLQGLAAGDLSLRLPPSGSSDFRSAAALINTVAARFEFVVHTTRNISDRVASNWQDLLLIGESMSASSEESAVQASQIADNAVATAASMNVLAAASEELAATIREIASHASAAATSTSEGILETTETGSALEELATASLQVGTIAKSIAGIAFKTKILALNANIEAANAGVAGPGFAVVAQEVRSLAEQTSAQTQVVSETVASLEKRSVKAKAAVASITSTMLSVAREQESIAAAVAQQSSVTGEIGRLAASTATSAANISGLLDALSVGNRKLAYGGSQSRSSAALLSELQAALSLVLGPFVVSDSLEKLDDDLGESSSPHVTASPESTATIVMHDDIGTGLNTFEFSGQWAHSASSEKYGSSDSYCCMPDDRAVLRFSGTRLRFYGTVDSHHGMAALSIDDGEEVLVDEYAPTRQSDVLLWTSPLLRSGLHTFVVRVPNTKNVRSTFFWTTVDRVEIDS